MNVFPSVDTCFVSHVFLRNLVARLVSLSFTSLSDIHPCPGHIPETLSSLLLFPHPMHLLLFFPMTRLIIICFRAFSLLFYERRILNRSVICLPRFTHVFRNNCRELPSITAGTMFRQFIRFVVIFIDISLVLRHVCPTLLQCDILHTVWFPKLVSNNRRLGVSVQNMFLHCFSALAQLQNCLYISPLGHLACSAPRTEPTSMHVYRTLHIQIHWHGAIHGKP